MCLKAPSFWYQPLSPLARALSPLSVLYAFGHRLHQRSGALYRSSLPVLCVGNLVAGGSGKTPVALAICELVKKHGIAARPFFLTRGYGGTLKRPVLVMPSLHTARDTGDEALLLARHAPTIVAANRSQGAQFAEKSGADLIIMDDGLQNRSLVKDIECIVVDAQSGFGNGLLLPAGPLRAPLDDNLTSDRGIIIIGRHQLTLPSGQPLYSPHAFQADVHTSWKPALNTRYIAFCGIGRPEKFFTMLETHGTSLILKRAFSDHKMFSSEDLNALAGQARQHQARLVTTEKDAVRLPFDFLRDHAVEIAPISIAWQDEESLTGFIRDRIKKSLS